jgi:hypothetical protein
VPAAVSASAAPSPPAAAVASLAPIEEGIIMSFDLNRHRGVELVEMEVERVIVMS